MKSVWRSWFWNIVLFLCTAAIAGPSTGVAVTELKSPADGAAIATAIGFGLMAVFFWGMGIRALIAGVYIKPDRVVVRRIARTTKVNWADIDSVETGRSTSGPSGVAGATAPVIKWKRPGETKTRELELDILGGYRSGPKSLSARAGQDINARLMDYRVKNNSA